jgi:glycosyltransferase involved in cell wall biosynthesis
MRVGLDVSLLAQTRAGAARYLRGLLGGLAGVDDLEVQRLALGGDGRLATLARDLAWYPVLLARRARRANCRVLHCPTYRAPLRPTSPPFVVTVHDVAVFRHPGAFPLWARTYSKLALPRVLRAARRIIAVSEFTRAELREVLGVDESRIEVIPNAVAATFGPDGPAASGEYVLTVGTLEPRKNLIRLAEAARRADVELRVVGARGWGDVHLNGAGIRWLGAVDDDQLATLYRGALCLAYPSLYEGFGIPVLEAMACGTPVVTSAGGATEEVAGGAAVLVDPHDPAGIALGIESAVGRRDELRRRGLARAGEFDWSATARATAAVYEEASA